ncbi:MAG: hypothetical protein LBG15_15505 [Dysgonamonadaceae bacterium]|jgi:hypothetical protein|nr:hypothetical protein [Dysgonamonadaceae bacterium]
MNNIFLDNIIKEERLCFNDDFSIVRDKYPVINGHYLLFPNHESRSLADCNIGSVMNFIDNTFSNTFVAKKYMLFERGRANFCTSVDGVIHAHAHLFDISDEYGDIFHLPDTKFYNTLEDALRGISPEGQYLLWGRFYQGFFVSQPIENIKKRLIRNTVGQLKEKSRVHDFR